MEGRPSRAGAGAGGAGAGGQTGADSEAQLAAVKKNLLEKKADNRLKTDDVTQTKVRLRA